MIRAKMVMRRAQDAPDDDAQMQKAQELMTVATEAMTKAQSYFDDWEG